VPVEFEADRLGLPSVHHRLRREIPRLWTDGDKSKRFDSERDSGWAQNIGPYLKEPRLLQCPSEPNAQDLRGGNRPNYSDYWMNARLAGASESQIVNHARTASLGDGLNGNASQSVGARKYLLPSIERRHLKGLNVAFTDWPRQVAQARHAARRSRWPKRKHTFSLR
jgi:hypothetical protein